MEECKPLGAGNARGSQRTRDACRFSPGRVPSVITVGQGLTVVRFSAQRKHYLWTTDVHFSA